MTHRYAERTNQQYVAFRQGIRDAGGEALCLGHLAVDGEEART